jgi:hypothetical protein
MIDNNLHPEFLQQLCGGSHQQPENRNSICCNATSASEANPVDILDAQITLTTDPDTHQQPDTSTLSSMQLINLV